VDWRRVDWWERAIEMRIKVRLFARARDLAGAPNVELDVPDPATVADLRRALLRSVPALEPLGKSLLVSVGSEYAGDGQLLSPGADVACFPPVSGG
jgi:molybdopterin converting factor small subunit